MSTASRALRRVHRLAWLLVGALALAACSPASEEATGGDSSLLDNVPLSAELRPAVEWTRPYLDGRTSSRPATRHLANARELELRIQRPLSRDQARSDLFESWEADPTDFLWIDLAYRYRYLLGHGELYESLIENSELADTTTVAGTFLLGCKNEYVGQSAPYFRQAAAAAAQLDSLSRMWLSLKLASTEARTGHPLESVARLQGILPEAMSVGGKRLAAELWRQIASGLRIGDRLDDALHAASLAERLSTQARDDYGAVMARLLTAEILAARHEYTAAWKTWDECIARADRADFPWPATNALNSAAGLALELSEPETALRYDRRILDQRLASRDSLNVPRVLVNVAYDHRLLAQPDSSLAALQRARRWVDAYHNRANLARMPLFEAEHWCFVGQYARAESLLAVAAGTVSTSGFPHEEASFLVSQARMGTELGLPDLAYRSVQRLRELQDAFYDTTPEQNLRAELELITAELLTQQGEFRSAQSALERARVAVGEDGALAKQWELHRGAGELALLRDDLRTARDEFERCLDIAQRVEDDDRQVESRSRLVHVLIEQGDHETARRLLAPAEADSTYGGRFRTRLMSEIVRGMILAREEHHAQAIGQFESVLASCSDRTPDDLMALLQTELGRADIAAGDYDAGLQALRAALTSLDRLGGRRQLPEIRAISVRPRRAATELLIGLLVDHPGLSGERELAAQTLDLARRCRPVASFETAMDEVESPTMVFFVGRERSFQWTKLADRWSVRALPARSELAELVDPVIFDVSRPDRSLDSAAAQRLAALLFEPLGSEAPDSATLNVVGDDILAAVPWAVLPRADGRMAIDHFAIREAPDLGFLAAGPSTTARPRSTLLSVGVNGGIDGAGDDAVLRSAEAEASGIARLWAPRPATLRLAQDASWSAIRELDLGGYDVIHVASHAVVHQGLPRRSTLRLASAKGSEPLTLVTARQLHLNTQLIYLSCCEAARPVGRGDSFDDFAGAFLQAGARAVVASRLRVDDGASAFLAERFYRHWLTGISAAEALRAAQLDMRAERPQWQHPFYWASYRVIGRSDR